MNKFSNVIEFVKARKEAKGDEGFSLIELVVAVGILAILSVTGVVAYSQITQNARDTATESAASDVFTAAVAYELDNDTETDAADAASEWNGAAGTGSAISVTATVEAGTLTVTATNTNANTDNVVKTGKI